MVEKHQDEVDNRIYHSCHFGYHHWCDCSHEQEEVMKFCDVKQPAKDDSIAILLFDNFVKDEFLITCFSVFAMKGQ